MASRPTGLSRVFGLVAAAVLLCGPPAVAEETSPAQLFVEAIAVQGARGPATEEIIREEARIRPGRAYGEAELWDAAYRVERLPFVLDATLALEKGSERDRYVLVLRVTETERVFFGIDERFSLFAEPLALSSGLPEDTSRNLRSLAGGRLFLGQSAEIFAAADTDQGLQTGLTWYGLFGRGGMARVTAGYHDFCCQSFVPALGLAPGFTRFSLGQETTRYGLDVSVPLSGSQALRLGVGRLTTEDASERPIVDPADDDFASWNELTHERVELAWVLDTTDDPLLPRRGHRAAGGVEGQWLDRTTAEDHFPFTPEADLNSRLVRLFGSYAQHRELGVRHAFSWGGRAAVGEGEIAPENAPKVSSTAWEVGGELGHRWRLWSRPGIGPRPELWWESGLEVSREEVDFDGRAAAIAVDRRTLRTGLSFRSTWGLVRLTVSYVDIDGGGR